MAKLVSYLDMDKITNLPVHSLFCVWSVDLHV